MNAENFEDAPILVVRCRLIADFNISVAVSAIFALFLIGLAVLQPLRNSEVAALLLALGLTVAAPLYWLIARIRGAIGLTPDGVRWRTVFGSWKSASWDEIESCDARLTSTATAKKYVISTRHGAFSWTKNFQRSDELARFAARFCPVIPPQIEDWPRFYNYRSVENGIPILAFPLFIWWLVAPLWMLFSASPRDLREQFEIQLTYLGWLPTLFAMLGMIVLGMLLPAVFLWIFWQMWRQSRARRNESFLLTSEGIIWRRDSGEPIFVPYFEVRELHTHSRGQSLGLPEYRLETARGALSWNHGLNGWAELHQELRERAPQLLQTSARHMSDSLDAAPEFGAQTLRFSFKTRGLRAILWLHSLLVLLCLGAAIFGPPPNRNEPMPNWVFGVAFLVIGAMTLYCFMLFHRGAIQLDSRGITWEIPLRNRFVAWSEIQNMTRRSGTKSEFGILLQVGKTRLPLFAVPFPTAHFESLLQAIERRLSEKSGEN